MFRTVLVASLTAACLFLTAPTFAADETKPDDAAGADTAKRHGELFDKLDANHDGFITADEVPADHKRLFDRLVHRSDKTADGKLSRDEFISGMAEDRTKDRPFAKLGPRPEGRPGEGPEGREPGPGERMMMGPLFRALDTNGDGKLDEKEIAAAADSLKKISKNGEITREDLTESAREAFGPGGPGAAGRPDLSPEEAAKHMIQRLDKNGDGKLQKSELPQRRQKDFDTLDTNHDGVLDEEEVKAAVPKIMERIKDVRTAKTEKRQKASGDEKMPEDAKPDDKSGEK